MARVTIESSAAPAVQGSLENRIQTAGALLMASGACAAALCPGAILGAAAAGMWRWYQRPPTWLRVLCAVVLLAPVLALRSFISVAWLWRDMLANALPDTLNGVDGAVVWRSIPIEALAGPLIFESTLLAVAILRRSVGGQIRRDHRRDKQRWRAISGQEQPTSQLRSMLPDPHTAASDADPDHPRGKIRLGIDRETNRPLDLALPDELASHVFLPGVSGAGKTTTLTRLADGAIANRYGVVIIDCKGGDLGGTARMLAERYHLPFNLVDPDAPESLGYNPCSGNAAAVANKLVGAFTYGPTAEIYKNIAMEAIPIVVRALFAAGAEVSLQALYDAFGPRGMAKLAQTIPGSDDESERLRQRLLSIDTTDRITKGGHAGLQRRLGALLEGKFGNIFRATHAFDWDKALVEPSVTYIALSTLASSEDVELMGRVIAQDLKQVCARRIKAQAQHGIVPVLAIFDEFAALREADQLSDLLRQARQALMPVVVSTQYIPLTDDLRKSVLGAGLLICHRVESEDAKALADQFGTRPKNEVTQQIDYATGYAERGSVKRVDAYNVHPNELRTFKAGFAALKSTARNRYTIVQVFRDHG